ncbi:MAG: ABC transporter transmembrane domain-containing protein [Odoribacter sp.]
MYGRSVSSAAQYVCSCPITGCLRGSEGIADAWRRSGFSKQADIHWGGSWLGGLVGGLVLLYAALMSSHVAAFRILYGLRVRLSEHIGRLPLGYLNNTSTGAIKKTMDQNIEKIEGFIAHTIPDLVKLGATVAVMLVIFFSLDVWLTVVCLAVVVISLFLQFSNFIGKRAKEFMGIYYGTGKDERICRAVCTGNACSQDIRAECPFVPSVQCRDSGIQDLWLKCCDHLPERDGRI